MILFIANNFYSTNFSLILIIFEDNSNVYLFIYFGSPCVIILFYIKIRRKKKYKKKRDITTLKILTFLNIPHLCSPGLNESTPLLSTFIWMKWKAKLPFVMHKRVRCDARSGA